MKEYIEAAAKGLAFKIIMGVLILAATILAIAVYSLYTTDAAGKNVCMPSLRTSVKAECKVNGKTFPCEIDLCEETVLELLGE